MKFKLIAAFIFSCITFQVSAQRIAADMVEIRNKPLSIQPLMHATFVLSYLNQTIYVDPTGGANMFKGLASPDIILVTDIHGDHLDTATINAVRNSGTRLIVPQAVADKLPSTIDKKQLIILNNGDKTKLKGISFKAIPMYNLPQAADAFHTKGRGNGYMLSIKDKNIYISGDTEDIPEMRSLKNIDIAFVCMNLPYTMDVNQAAQGVLAFSPKVVYPYHYRGQDTNTFKSLINAGNKDIDVRLRNWYPAK